MRAQFRFMMAGDAYEVDVPAGTNSDPDISAAFIYGELARPLIYEPTSHRTDPAHDGALTPLVDGHVNGTKVATYRLTEHPSTLIAFWRLGGGYIHTFMDDLVGLPAGCGEADLTLLLKNVIGAISISDARFGPFVVLSAPLRAADPRDPLLRETVTFNVPNREAPISALVFRREPGWGREGTVVHKDDAMVEVRVTTAAQIAVSAYGPPDRAGAIEELAASAAASLAPL